MRRFCATVLRFFAGLFAHLADALDPQPWATPPEVDDDLPVPQQFPLTNESLRLMYRPAPRVTVSVPVATLEGSAASRMRARRDKE